MNGKNMQEDFVDWNLARRVAVRAVGSEPYTAPFHRRGLDSCFAEFTEQAEALVADCTGLRSQSGPARSRLISRVEWIDANIASFQRMLQPISSKLSDRADKMTAPLARRVSGIEFGFVLGWMSKRVMGQYDLLITEDDNADEQDIVYYVAPNVLALENRYAFNSAQFRLWLALHEVTHRAQFTGISWMRSHFLKHVQGLMNSMDLDPKYLIEAFRRVARRVGEEKTHCLQAG